MNTKKMKLLYLLDILSKETNEHHPVSMPDLIDRLEQLGISSERKSIYEDIKTLQDWQMDILFTRTPRQGYYLASRSFDPTEIKVLVDMISSAEFISTKKSKQLIQKCCDLTSIHDAHEIKKQINLSTKKKENEHLFYSIHSIQEAITRKHSISFQYFDFSIKNEKLYRKNAQLYHLIPLTLIFENQRYYCIGYSEKYGQLSHYRVDKMDNVQLGTFILPQKNFSVKKYIHSNFKLTLGDVENVSIQFDNSVFSLVQDALGTDLFLERRSESSFVVNLSTSLSMPFISWILQFGSSAKVLKPKKLIQKIIQSTSDVQKVYSTSSKSFDEQ